MCLAAKLSALSVALCVLCGESFFSLFSPPNPKQYHTARFLSKSLTRCPNPRI